jgi:hypothetical protein
MNRKPEHFSALSCDEGQAILQKFRNFSWKSFLTPQFAYF